MRVNQFCRFTPATTCDAVMVGSTNVEPSSDEQRTATRWATNPNWSYRGDNTKYKETK